MHLRSGKINKGEANALSRRWKHLFVSRYKARRTFPFEQSSVFTAEQLLCFFTLKTLQASFVVAVTLVNLVIVNIFIAAIDLQSS